MSCLYRALSYFHPDYSTDQMRATLCQYLGSNPDLSMGKADQVVPWETGMSLPQYIQRMRHPSSWGGAIEIKAYADLFRRNIKVYSLPNRRSIEFLTASNSDQVNWIGIYWTGGHYEPIRSQQQHDQLEQSMVPSGQYRKPGQLREMMSGSSRQNRPNQNHRSSGHGPNPRPRHHRRRHHRHR